MLADEPLMSDILGSILKSHVCMYVYNKSEEFLHKNESVQLNQRQFELVFFVFGPTDLGGWSYRFTAVIPLMIDNF